MAPGSMAAAQPGRSGESNAPPGGPGPCATDTLPQRPPLLDSEQLLQGHKAVEISHKGVRYRLQATRQGKLILTK